MMIRSASATTGVRRPEGPLTRGMCANSRNFAICETQMDGGRGRGGRVRVDMGERVRAPRHATHIGSLPPGPAAYIISLDVWMSFPASLAQLHAALRLCYAHFRPALLWHWRNSTAVGKWGCSGADGMIRMPGIIRMTLTCLRLPCTSAAAAAAALFSYALYASLRHGLGRGRAAGAC